MNDPLKSPYPYFGGKSKVAELIWSRFGSVRNYVEPFFGSGASLLLRPIPFDGSETVNDLDGMVSNFWRAIRRDPDQAAFHADNPVNENDLHGRHAWLVGQKESLQAKLEGDPDYFDPKIAGWWVWGMACWIGSGFCSGKGPWHVVDRKLVHLGSDGQGINRQLVHLGDEGRGINRKLVQLSGWSDKGVCSRSDISDYFHELSSRLARVRVCCGDWSRVCGPSVTHKHGLTAVLLDPPYADTAKRTENLYRVDCNKVAHAVREWAMTEGSNPLMRIALCGYEGEHEMPGEWECVAWKATGGFSLQNHEVNGNSRKERIWFSPACVAPENLLFTI